VCVCVRACVHACVLARDSIGNLTEAIKDRFSDSKAVIFHFHLGILHFFY
jgi:hypothetical protein